MNKEFGVSKKLFVESLIVLLVMLGCTQDKGNPHSTDTDSAVANPAVTMPSIAVRPSPTGTVSPMVSLATATPQVDDRRGRYLLPSDIDPEIANVIQLALEERLSYPASRGKRFFSYALLATPEKTDDGLIKAYIYVEDREYYVEHGELKESGGGNVPAAVTMKKKENGWQVEVQRPVSGNWGPSIRAIFPKELWPLIFRSPPIPHAAIEMNIIRQAEEHFGLKFNPAKNSFPPKQATATPAIRILTPTPTPTLDISTLELDVSGRVDVEAEYVWVAVDLYPEVRRPFYKGLLSSGWRVYIKRRRMDDDGSPQKVLILDEPKESVGPYEFAVMASLDEIRATLGNSRGFIYQVVDDAGKVFFQDEFYIRHNLHNQYQGNVQKTFPDGYQDYMNEGLIIGFPNALSDHVSPIFLVEEGLITVREPPDGFYALYFEYNIAGATGVTGTDDLQALSKNLTAELFPCQEDGSGNEQAAVWLSGKISEVSGIYQVGFPHEWLDQPRHGEQTSCIRIVDKDGNVYKEVRLRFIPYVP